MQPLRDYQARAKAQWESHWGNGARRVLLVSPTGSGKTRMGEEGTVGATHSLWLAHRNELIRDASERLRASFGHLEVGIIAAGAQPSPYSRIQVTSVQTIINRDESTWPVAERVIADECHHFRSDKWSRILAHYNEALHLGLTATPERQDGKAMSGAYDVMAVAANYSELLQAGYLCGVRVFRPDHIMGANTLALDPVQAWLKYSEGSPGFAFFGSVDSAYEYEHKMNAAGIRAAVVEGFTEKAKRLEAIDALRNGELDCICNVYTMTEGVDVPNARVCMLAARLQHVGGYLQRVGRVLRSHASKENAILIDLVGASTLHGLPTEDRIYSLDGDAIKRQDITPLRGCKVCGAQVPSAFAACTECGTPFPVKSREQAGPKIYSLELREVYAGKDTPPDAKRAEYMRLRKLQQLNNYDLYFVQKSYRETFGEPVIISDATTEEKRLFLNKLRAVQKARGTKPGMIYVRFKEMFGHAPPYGAR